MARLHALALVLVVALGPACAPAKSVTSAEPDIPPVEPDITPAEPDIPPAEAASAAPETVSFENDIRPILQSRCMPCHFEGGVMYAKLPFDTPATIRQLGERLFTRIRKEEEQTLIRAFLAQDCGTAPAGTSQDL